MMALGFCFGFLVAVFGLVHRSLAFRDFLYEAMEGDLPRRRSLPPEDDDEDPIEGIPEIDLDALRRRRAFKAMRFEIWQEMGKRIHARVDPAVGKSASYVRDGRVLTAGETRALLRRIGMPV